MEKPASPSKPLTITLFGATGPTGQFILQGALAAGYQVTAVARTPEKIVERSDKLSVERGDVLDPESVMRAVAGSDAVVSALGVPLTRKPVTVYSVSAQNILAAMHRHAVRRFIGITSGGTHPGRDPNNPFFFERIIKPIFHSPYDDMREMERIIMASDIDFTIFRPSRLLDKPATGKVRIAKDAYSLPRGGTVSRADLAALIVTHLSSGELVRKGVAVAD